MNVQALIEMAVLDALGLLDEEERTAFEEAFWRAPPAIQAQIRREQTRLSRLEALLPEVEPPAGLRAAVLEAVRREMAAARSRTDTASLLIRGMLRPRAVSPVWRAATVGLAAATIIFGLTTLHLRNEYDALTTQIRNDALIDLLARQFGHAYVYDLLFDPRVRRVVLTATDPAFRARASVFVHPEWAMFYCQGMPTGGRGPYMLAIVDEQGRVVQPLASLSSEGELVSIRLDLPANAQGRVAVLAPRSDGSGMHIVMEGWLSA